MYNFQQQNVTRTKVNELPKYTGWSCGMLTCLNESTYKLPHYILIITVCVIEDYISVISSLMYTLSRVIDIYKRINVISPDVIRYFSIMLC